MRNKKIIEYLLRKNVRPELKGFMYLHDAIQMTLDNNGVLPAITKEIYPKIGIQYNDTKSAVERGIRFAIENSCKETKLMSCSQFIAKASIDLIMDK